jgi:hypothetical protein
MFDGNFCVKKLPVSAMIRIESKTLFSVNSFDETAGHRRSRKRRDE